MRVRPVALVLTALLVAQLVMGANAVRIDPPRDHVVFGASGPQLAAQGYDVIDDYATYATAKLLDDDVDVLRAQGLKVELLDHRLGRGAYYGELSSLAIPVALRAAADEPYFLVQYRGPVKAAWLDDLEARAQLVVGYLPQNAYLARLDANARTALATNPTVRAVEPWHPAFRLPVGMQGATGSVEVLVMAARDADVATMTSAVQAAGGEVDASALNAEDLLLLVTIDASRMSTLAAVRHVVAIEPAYTELVYDNAGASSMTQGGPGGAFAVHDRGIDGSTQKAAMCDDGIDHAVVESDPTRLHNVVRFEHEMFDDVADGRVRVNDHLPPPSSLPEHRKVDLYFVPIHVNMVNGGAIGGGHGTHTAGTLAGDAPPYGVRNAHDGVAFAAKLVVCNNTRVSDGKVIDYTHFFAPAEARGAQIHSNSYRFETPLDPPNRYGILSRQQDSFTWTHPQFLIFRSTGNHHPATYISPEPYAKNVVAVGSILNDGSSQDMAPTSVGSVLPDGRIRPTITAPGQCLWSAGVAHATAYVCWSGTSMATPTAAGAGVLVRDYFAKGFYPGGAAGSGPAIAPSAALVRGMLMASGVEISGDRALAAFPNHAQGWGRVHLEDVLYFAGDARKLAIDDAPGLLTGQTYSRPLAITGGQPFRVMLAWSDHPAIPDANPALVNDLDLVLRCGSDAYVGNAFVGSETPPDQGKRDTKSVEEAVYVHAPTSGTCTVTVRGSFVPLGPQPFAVVATGGVAWAGPATVG